MRDGGRRVRWGLGLLAALVLLPLALIGFGYWTALRAPVVRDASVAVPDWPAGAPPVTVLLVSDVHVGLPDMPPERAARIMDGLAALRPDLILLAGDYISDKFRDGGPTAWRNLPADQVVAPLGRLKAPLGVVAVMGNHDYGTVPSRIRRAIRQRGITLLVNQAVRRGPFVIGGVDDGFTGHADLRRTEAAMAALGAGPRLLLSHVPDMARARRLPVAAVLAGHTHCGQVKLPFAGIVAAHIRKGRWFPCGEAPVGGVPLFVGAGLGTSIIPFRLGAPPDVWRIRFGPAASMSPLVESPSAH